MTHSISFLDRLEDIVEYFQLGKIIQVNELETGLRSANYFVTTHQNDQYVIRCSEEFIKRRFDNIHTIQSALRPTELHTNFMIASPGGSYIYSDKTEKLYATVSKKVEGYHPGRPVSEKDCRKVGKLLAQFHVYLPSTLDVNSYDLFVGQSMVKRELQNVPNPDDLKNVTSLLNDSAGVFETMLPSGILHGDLHTNNVLLDTEGNGTLLDLECSGFGPYILDIGRSIADICSSDGVIDQKNIEAFTEGYEELRKLTTEEVEHLNEAIAWGSACVALWGFAHNVKSVSAEFMAIGRAVLSAK
jgi:Ser/Thr protein kinase RdoA (MazF antagonist)